MKEFKNIFSWVNPKLEIRETNKYGKGVFTKKDISKNEILTIFGGYIMTAMEEAKLPAEICDNGLQISKDFVISIKKRSELEIASFFNHSCDPNAGFKGQIVLVPLRKIKRNEEITFDYAMVLHKTKNVKPYIKKCMCKSKNCREQITDKDWMREDLIKRYRGYFQSFIEEKINKKTK